MSWHIVGLVYWFSLSSFGRQNLPYTHGYQDEALLLFIILFLEMLKDFPVSFYMFFLFKAALLTYFYLHLL